MLKKLYTLLYLSVLLPFTATAQDTIVSVRNVCIGDIVTVKVTDFPCTATGSKDTSGVDYAPSDKPLLRFNSDLTTATMQLNHTGTVYAYLTCNNRRQKIKINYLDCDSAKCFGVNLVPNPSVEKIIKCDNGLLCLTGNAELWLDYPNYSNSATKYGSSDLLHKQCLGRSNARFIDNIVANDPPRTGEGMIGSYVFTQTYVQGLIVYNTEFPVAVLTQPLTIGQRYRVHFFVKPPTLRSMTFPIAFADKIGASFSVGDPDAVFRKNRTNFYDYIGEPAKAFNPAGKFISDTLFWTKIEGTFIAEKPYTHLIVGNLGGLNTLPAFDSQTKAYYLFDDFSVQSMEQPYLELTQADTIVCRGQTASVSFKTDALDLSLTDLFTNQTKTVPANLPITIPNLLQSKCYQLALNKNNCRDTFSFCMRNYPSYDTLLNRFSCLVKDTGIVNKSLKSVNGCDSFVHIRTSLVEPTIIDLGLDTAISVGSRFRLVPKFSGDSVQIYFWQPSSGLSCTDCRNPEVRVSQTTRYSLTVTNRGGCKSSAEKFIKSLDEGFIYVPNAFSPNGDGVNEVVTVYGDPKRVELIKRFSIYDRWGNLIFIKRDFAPNDEKSGWNGWVKDSQISNDVFVYVVEFMLFDKFTPSSII